MSDAQAIGSLVLAATQLLTLVVLFRKLSGKETREITPQPLSVRQDLDNADRFASKAHDHLALLSKDEHEKICGERKKDMDRNNHALDGLKQAVNDMEKGNEDRARRIHARIDSLITPLHQLIGKVENHIAEHKKGAPA